MTAGETHPTTSMERQIGDVERRLAAGLDHAARLYAAVASRGEVDVCVQRCVFSVSFSHSARRRRVWPPRVKREGEGDVMMIEIWKEKDGQWAKYDSRYDTAQLLAPYAEQLRKSEEAARDILEEYMADLILEFSRLVDGAFLPAQPCHAANPSPRLRR